MKMQETEFPISMRFEWMHTEWEDQENQREINWGNPSSFLPITCYMNNNNNNINKKNFTYLKLKRYLREFLFINNNILLIGCF